MNNISLFQLIKSLDKTEKTYFKRFSSIHVRGKQNNYVRLFDAINKQSIYNEEKLLKKFENERFTNQFAVAKNYLYNLILKSLTHYHSDVESEIQSLIHKAEILKGKNLESQSESLIKKAKDIAIKHEKFNYAAECASKLLVFPKAKRLSTKEEDVLETEELYDEIRDIYRLAENLVDYRKKYTELMQVYGRLGVARDAENIAEIEHIVKSKLIENEDEARSISSLLKLYEVKIWNSIITSDFKSYNKYTAKSLMIFQKNQSLIQTNKDYYIYLHYSHCDSCLRTKKYDEALLHIKQMRSLEADNKFEKSIIFVYSCMAELHYHLDTKNYTEGVEYVEKLEILFSESKDLAIADYQKYHICFYAANLSLAAGSYHNALQWINLTLVEYKNFRLDLHCIVQIMELIIHYELKSYGLLEYKIRSTYRFLLKKDRLFKLEKTFINYIKKLIEIHSEKELRLFFEKLKIEIEDAVKDPMEQQFLANFDIVSWLAGKVKQVSTT